MTDTNRNTPQVVDEALDAIARSAPSTNHGGNNVVVPVPVTSSVPVKTVDIEGLEIDGLDRTITEADGSTEELKAERLVAKAINSQVPQLVHAIAKEEVVSAEKNRQRIEDARSIKRNRNRIYTLVFALFASVVITYCLSTILKGTWVGETFGPYSFAITILFDSGLTVWAYWHRY